MPKKVDKSAVSTWSWFLTIFMIALPCVGIAYVVIGAFCSPNESRRNFYRAHLLWIGIVIGFYLSLFAIGYAPDIRKMYEQYRHDGTIGTKDHSADNLLSPAKKKSTKMHGDSE